MNHLLDILAQTTQSSSWKNPDDVYDFLAKVFGPTGLVVGLISLILAFRAGTRATTAQTTSAEAKGKADAVVVTASNLQQQNADQAKQITEINRALPNDTKGTP